MSSKSVDMALVRLAAVALLAATSASAQAPAAPPHPATAGADGFAIQSDGGDYRLQFGAYTHFDGRLYPGDEDGVATNQFLLRRVRPILRGTIAKHFEFNITPDFGGGNTVLQDAYLDVRYSPQVRVRIGKFKVPLGLERLQSATAITFVERASPSALLPVRDVGAQVFGEVGAVSYAVGVFEGALDGSSADLDTNDGKDVAARVYVSPFKNGPSRLKALGFGVSGSVGTQTGALPSYRSGGQLTIVSYAAGVTADGTRKRFSPQLSLYTGPLGLLAEYAQSNAFVKKASNGRRTEVGVKAWQTTATWTLTGEPASFGGVRPKNAFDPAQGQWGAFELAARVNAFEIGDEVVTEALVDPTRSVREAFAWAVGLNWYLNRHVKQVLSYERTSFEGGAPAGADRPDESAVLFRTQLSF